MKFSGASASWQPFTGNFNGDKYTDIAFYNRDTGEVRVALGTGSGFSAPTTWISGAGTGYTVMSGDFNGDSLSDLCLFNKATGEFKVAFSNTKAFVDLSVWATNFAKNQDALLADFNSDGLTDIGYCDKDAGVWYYAASTGRSFGASQEWLSGFPCGPDETATTGDFDGNGITNAAVFNRNGIGADRWRVHLSTNKPPDLLTQIDNGVGGVTSVSYGYVSGQADLPFPVYVAQSVTTSTNIPTSQSYTSNAPLIKDITIMLSGNSADSARCA